MGNSVLITRHTLADPLKAITDYLSELTGIGIKIFLSLKKRISYGFVLNFSNPQSQLSMELTLSFHIAKFVDPGSQACHRNRLSACFQTALHASFLFCQLQ